MLLLCTQTNTIPTRRLGGWLLHCHNVQAKKHPAEASQAQLRSTTKQGALHHLGLTIWDLAGGTGLAGKGQANKHAPRRWQQSFCFSHKKSIAWYYNVTQIIFIYPVKIIFFLSALKIQW
jgi:hypothetical protein